MSTRPNAPTKLFIEICARAERLADAIIDGIEEQSPIVIMIALGFVLASLTGAL
jgi:hypothetical protein